MLLTAGFVALVLTAAGSPRGGQMVAPITYEQFERLSLEQQKVAFGQSSAETKAALLRAHAQQWLARHRSQLTAAQVVAVEQGIQFITPDIYRGEPKTAIENQSRVVERLECQLGRVQARAAFTFFPAPERMTFLQWTGNLISQIGACFGF